MKKIFVVLALFAITLTAQTKIEIKDAWIRPGASKANTALFFEVHNNTSKGDTLLMVKADLSEIVELHETYKKSEDVMGMRAVKIVSIPANSVVKFKPRDLHIMLIGLYKDVKIGESHNVTLVFKFAKDVKVKAVVRDMPKM